MLKHTLSFLALACTFSVLSTSQLHAQDQPDAPALYKKNCSMCHKADGKGYAAMKTPDFTNKEWQASHKDEEMIESVSKGKGTMPPFEKKLKPEEINLIITEVVRKFAE